MVVVEVSGHRNQLVFEAGLSCVLFKGEDAIKNDECRIIRSDSSLPEQSSSSWPDLKIYYDPEDFKTSQILGKVKEKIEKNKIFSKIILVPCSDVKTLPKEVAKALSATTQ